MSEKARKGIDVQVEKVISEYLDSKASKKIKYSIERLEMTPLVDHHKGLDEDYSCLILPVTVNLSKTIKDHDKRLTSEEELKLIIKTLPENCQDESLKMSFIKEVVMYDYGIKKFIEAQKLAGIDDSLFLDTFPKCYGSYDWAKGNTDFLLVLRDLQMDGYVLPDQRCGLNMEETKLAITKLAHFHAVGFIIKEKKKELNISEQFEFLVKPYLRHETNPEKKNINLQFRKEISSIIAHYNLCEYVDPVDITLERIDMFMIPAPKEPFATVTHNDIWKNNILFEYNTENSSMVPTKLKILDYQFVTFNSPSRDLVHFIYTSTKQELQDNFEEFSQIYYDSLIKYLKLFKINVDELTFDAFLQDIQQNAFTKLKHIISLLFLTSDKEMLRYKLQYVLFNFKKRGWFQTVRPDNYDGEVDHTI